jgi:hypothetical protein
VGRFVFGGSARQTGGATTMATCSECGREIHDDAWVCGLCGAPVTAGESTPDTGSQYEYAEAVPGDYTSSQYVPGAPVTAGAAPSRAGHSQLIWVVGLAGLVAVLAIVLVWFFVLRGPGAGVGFAGTWRTTTADATEVIISAKAGGYELSIANKGDKSIGPFITHMVNGNLTTSLEATAASSDKQKAAAALFKQIMGNVYQGFTMIFTQRSSDDTLVLTLQGMPSTAGQEAVLHRVH